MLFQGLLLRLRLVLCYTLSLRCVACIISETKTSPLATVLPCNPYPLYAE
jgi:hypothetical protein